MTSRRRTWTPSSRRSVRCRRTRSTSGCPRSRPGAGSTGRASTARCPSPMCGAWRASSTSPSMSSRTSWAW
ncbi:hypothetical protein D7Y27_03615 [Corallococcus sp. AB004]|nr:hypothetical protein D7Y04_08495 [Corallococcus sp. AB038B]RKI49344.1 hypothetical protein D7Y27_03615 [Corallococcus sp. AB004]